MPLDILLVVFFGRVESLQRFHLRHDGLVENMRLIKLLNISLGDLLRIGGYVSVETALLVRLNSA